MLELRGGCADHLDDLVAGCVARADRDTPALDIENACQELDQHTVCPAALRRRTDAHLQTFSWR